MYSTSHWWDHKPPHQNQKSKKWAKARGCALALPIFLQKWLVFFSDKIPVLEPDFRATEYKKTHQSPDEGDSRRDRIALNRAPSLFFSLPTVPVGHCGL